MYLAESVKETTVNGKIKFFCAYVTYSHYIELCSTADIIEKARPNLQRRITIGFDSLGTLLNFIQTSFLRPHEGYL